MDPQTTPVETYESLASLLDWHLLEATLSGDAVAEACRKAHDYRLRSVVVRPCDLHLVTQWLSGSGVKIASVAGYPFGTSTTATKLYEGRELLRIGAGEVGFVLNPASMLARAFQQVETELQQIARSCQEAAARLTVIYNNRWLTDDLKIIATKICRRCEVNTLAIDHSEADLTLLRPLLKDVLTLKYASPANTLEEALAAREAGYASIATTEPAAVLDAWRSRLAEQQKQLS